MNVILPQRHRDTEDRADTGINSLCLCVSVAKNHRLAGVFALTEVDL